MAASAINIQPGPALALATSAEDAVRTSPTLALNLVEVGSISVQCTSSLTGVDGNVTATFVPQVSQDGTTWYDLQTLDQVSRPVQTTYAGAAPALQVTTTALSIPTSAHAWAYFQVLAILGGATTTAGDQTAVAVWYCPANVNALYVTSGG